jgi:hypothetical protein
MPSNADLLMQAIEEKKQVVCTYDNYPREMCPHTMGIKNKTGLRQVISFQFGGGSSRGLPPGGEWRCMRVDEITNLQLREGPWHTGPNHSRPQTCVDQIEAEVIF